MEGMELNQEVMLTSKNDYMEIQKEREDERGKFEVLTERSKHMCESELLKKGIGFDVSLKCWCGAGGEPFKAELHKKRALYLSQACIGKVEKDNSESIYLFVNVNGKKLVLGTLNSEKVPQQAFDLVFDMTFELSHNWVNGSVFFHGYTADNDISDHLTKDSSDSDSLKESSSSKFDEDIPVIALNRGMASEVKQEDSKVNAGKNSAAGKQRVMTVESNKDASSEDSDDSSDGDATSSEDDPKVCAKKDAAVVKQKSKIAKPKNDASSEDDADSSIVDKMSEDSSEDNEDSKSTSDEDSDSDEDEVTPVQVKSIKKKRASVSTSKKHVPEKKAKLITPEKIDGKKGSVTVLCCLGNVMQLFEGKREVYLGAKEVGN